ncbi:MAG TPA: DUF2652 domain-containing protein [Saprospiraceae bacterium]|nr:DUF2652 domain-containing protein [Saprospiraceae bacterium]
MENKGLVFIPDISGFTQFINKVEIVHSKAIIQELLEILVSANNIGLEISEIEGDAILFYKYGEAPDLETLYKQVEKMFCEFHRSLGAYEISRYCQCQACTSAIELTLKVITHYGEFTDYHVASFKKLIGKDIIVAHQLLKNDIDQHEYWLVTNDVMKNTLPASLSEEMQWHTSVKQTENGEIVFQYAQLSSLKNKIPHKGPHQMEIPNKIKVMSFTKDFDIDIITLFRTTGMFEYRPQWQEEVKSVEELNHYLPRVGMKCKYVDDAGEKVIYSSHYSFSPEKIEFTETDESKSNATAYLIEKITDNKTKLTMDFYKKKSFLENTLFNLTEKKKRATKMERSFQKLEELVKVIEFPF